MINKPKLFVSCDDMTALVDSLAQQVFDSRVSFTHILAVARGGAVPAIWLSHALDLPVAFTDFSSKDGNGEGFSSKFEWMDSKHRKIDTTSRVLVVDDICDTGHTLNAINGELSKLCYTRTAVLYNRENDVFKASFAGETINDDTGWVIFPYEMD